MNKEIVVCPLLSFRKNTTTFCCSLTGLSRDGEREGQGTAFEFLVRRSSPSNPDACIAANPLRVFVSQTAVRTLLVILFPPRRHLPSRIKQVLKTNSRSNILPAADSGNSPSALWELTQATILREVFHNITGMYDPELEKWMGLDPDGDKCGNGNTICISQHLKDVGCVGSN